MKKLVFAALVAALISCFLAAMAANAEVVRPAPDFTWAAGKTLKSLRGQPVVLLFAPSPKLKEFRKQVARLEAKYHEFAAQNTVFVVAFTQNDGKEFRSSIPFLVASEGAETASRYGSAAPFGLMVIGKDGNLDLKTAKLSPASAVRDAISNAQDLQASERKP